MKVLLAIDGSPHSEAALASALRVLPLQTSEVDLISVVPKVEGHARGHGMRHRAEKLLDAAVKRLAQERVNAKATVSEGSAARILIGASRNHDVIVMGSASRRDGWTGLGPVTGRVVEHSPSSVLVGREMPPGPGLRILIPVDGSDVSLRAVQRLSTLVDLSEADVTLLHVVETPWLHAGDDQEWAGYEESAEVKIDPQAQWEREFENRAVRVLERARTGLPIDIAANTVVRRGLPAEEILDEAVSGEYGLIIVCAGATQDLKHEILGSTSAKVVWNAECPVLVVRGLD